MCWCLIGVGFELVLGFDEVLVFLILVMHVLVVYLISVSEFVIKI